VENKDTSQQTAGKMKRTRLRDQPTGEVASPKITNNNNTNDNNTNNSNNNNNKNKNNNKNNSEKTCFYCKKKGNVKEDCFKLKKKQESANISAE